MITKLSQIIDAVLSRPRKRLVVAYAQDSHTLQSVGEAVDRGIVDATLIGDPAEIGRICREEGIDEGKFTIIAESVDVKCVAMAVQMIHEGKADILMKGLVSTDKYMRGILNKEYGLVPPKGVLSHVVVLQLPDYPRLLLASDVAVIPAPELSQKVAIAKYLIRTAEALGNDNPRMAFIAPSEQMLPGIPSCVDAAILAKMADRGQLGRVTADGPLALDVALFEEAARTKKLTSPVAGHADCLLFPNLDAANVFFKSSTKLAHAELAGMVVGTKAPCVLTSRDDSKASKLYSIALAALSAR
ncbi:MAG: phosphate butyryltransferase [Rikenellaceae bacterium]|nr:phosphate butyryltransferase [Rikenellaceae bacterium]